MTGLGVGVLLVATAELDDPHFEGTVVLLLGVESDGAMGIVLNRPSGVLVEEGFDGWDDVACEPGVIFEGGPVHTEGAVAIGMLKAGRQPPPGFSPLLAGHRLGYVDIESGPDVVMEDLDAIRFFAGYAGWASGQLEQEIEQGAWFVVESEDVDVHREDFFELRRAALRRQPDNLAWESTRPVDPDLN